MLKRWSRSSGWAASRDGARPRALAIPAIDLLGGRVVRLRQGRYQEVTSYGADPLALAEAYAAAGASWLHVVDLDAARAGARPPQHEGVLRRLAGVAGLALQVGGGVRAAADVEALLELGAARVLVGTLAARDPEAVGALVRRGCVLAVAADCAGGTVRAAGWLEDTGVPVSRFVSRLVELGVRDVLVTAIERDGTGAGPDTPLLAELRPLVPGVLLAAGGIGSAAHVAAAVHAGADGVVVGRALLEGSLTLPEALSAAAGAARRA